MRQDTGGPAFPRPASEDTTSGSQTDGNTTEDAQVGMTLRDYFAGRALSGLVNLAGRDVPGEVELAYRYADAMIAARSPKKAGAS